MKLEESYLQIKNKQKIFYRTLTPINPTAIVITIHGWGVHSNQNKILLDEIAKNNFVVYAPDLRGHGLSSGQRGYIKSWSEYLDDITLILNKAQEQYPNLSVFIFGHSMGGLVATRFVEHNNSNPRIKGLILSAPLFKLAVRVSSFKKILAIIMSSIFPRLSLNQKLDHKSLTKDNNALQILKDDPYNHNKANSRWYTEMAKNKAIAILKANTIQCPVLTLHGDADTINAIEGSQNFYNNLSYNDNNKFNIYPSFYHNLCEEVGGDIVIKDIIDWLLKVNTK